MKKTLFYVICINDFRNCGGFEKCWVLDETLYKCLEFGERKQKSQIFSSTQNLNRTIVLPISSSHKLINKSWINPLRQIELSSQKLINLFSAFSNIISNYRKINTSNFQAHAICYNTKYFFSLFQVIKKLIHVRDQRISYYFFFKYFLVQREIFFLILKKLQNHQKLYELSTPVWKATTKYIFCFLLYILIKYYKQVSDSLFKHKNKKKDE